MLFLSTEYKILRVVHEHWFNPRLFYTKLIILILIYLLIQSFLQLFCLHTIIFHFIYI